MNYKPKAKGLNLEFNATEREIIDCLMAENKCSPTKAVKIALHELNKLRATDCSTTTNNKENTHGKSNK